MISDFRSAPNNQIIHSDICIIGAGAAGISISKLLAGTKIQVCLLESGGLDYEEETQNLYDGEVIGQPWFDANRHERGLTQDKSELLYSRLRYFGGSTNHWGGGCLKLGDMDFQERDWVPHSGWPIGKAELEPYYERACALLRLSHDVNSNDLNDERALPFDPHKFYYYSSGIKCPPEPTRFGSAYRNDIDSAGNINCLLHANVFEIKVNSSASNVEYVDIRTLDGKQGKVYAKIYVLACGGIENARIMLLSDSVAQNGIGNKHDIVGRYFMDHPRGTCGAISTSVPKRFEATEDVKLGEICISPSTQQKEKILQARVRLIDQEDGEVPDGIRAVRDLEDIVAGRLDANKFFNVSSRIALDITDVVSGIYRRARGQNVITTHHIDLELEFEQAPNPDSRIMLADDIDALGQRKVRLDWRLTDLDLKTYAVVATKFAEELGRLNLGRVRLPAWMDAVTYKYDPDLGGASHHTGTTRMSDDPEKGVVDRNCRVHGVNNLFIAGSSIFPTSSWVLPTWTIVAMSIRLTDNIRSIIEN